MINLLEEISIQLNRWLLLAIMLLGVLFNLINAAVFIRPVFNHHVCSWYYLTLAVNNGIYSLIILTYRTLADGFQIQEIRNSFRLCQFISYVSTLCTGISHGLTALVAIDRWFTTNIQYRQFNSFRMMPWTILIMTMLCALLAIVSPIVTDLKTIDGFGCNIRANTIYNQCYLIIQLILFDLIAPILMIIFTLLTVQNRKLIGNLPITVSRCRRMEYNLTTMCFCLVVVHLALDILEWIDYLILLRPNIFQSCMFIQSFIRIPIYFYYVLPICWYLRVGKEFRREFRKVISISTPLIRHF